MAYEKSCLCQDLAGSAQRCWGIDPNSTPVICPGPNTVNFRRIVSFNEMVGHIYGRNNVLPADSKRLHVTLREFELYIEYLENEVGPVPTKGPQAKWFERFRKGLEGGIVHLRQLAADGWIDGADTYLATLAKLETRFHAAVANKVASVVSSESLSA
jgi:hypothetical protein